MGYILAAYFTNIEKAQLQKLAGQEMMDERYFTERSFSGKMCFALIYHLSCLAVDWVS